MTAQHHQTATPHRTTSLDACGLPVRAVFSRSRLLPDPLLRDLPLLPRVGLLLTSPGAGRPVA